jgi:hypothetical protein
MAIAHFWSMARGARCLTLLHCRTRSANRPEQRPGCGVPVAHLLGLFHAGTGVLLKLVVAPLLTYDLAQVRRSGRTRKGNRALCRMLIQCAWAACKTPTFLGHTFRRLEGRLGGKKAATAVAHKILVIGYYLLLEGRAMRRRVTSACRTDRRNASRNARSRPWSDSATASPRNAWPSGKVLHILSSTRHSPLPCGSNTRVGLRGVRDFVGSDEDPSGLGQE